MKPYYEDDDVQLYLGDMREILPALGLQADLIVADPPYAETSLAWDRWPDGWPTLAASVASSMWCFGSMRMFLDRSSEFADWKLSQDIVWQKKNPSGPDADRFRRVHEHALHWYQGAWRDVHRDPQRITTGVSYTTPQKQGVRAEGARSTAVGGVWIDEGTRLMTTVIPAAMSRSGRIHPTEKPIGKLLDPLIRYACPEGGLVVDPFAGSGSTLDAARQAGRRAVGIERHEPYAEAAARRLSALVLT